MNIGGDQIRGAFFNFFIVKKCLFYIFQTLLSVSKITTDSTCLYYLMLLSVHQMGSSNNDILDRLSIVNKYVQIVA